MGSAPFADDKVKPAALAGTWYPGDARTLDEMLNDCLKKAALPELSGEIGVIISPHAGYVYSAPTASFGFKAASSQTVNTVIILAPSHQYSFKGASVWPEGAFETPLGALEVDKELAAMIMAFDKRFIFRRDVFEGSAGQPENSVETQLPLIKKIFPSARILPVIVGYPPDVEMVKTIASALDAAIGDRTDVLIDISVDQSHFHSLKEAKVIDARGLKAIEDMDINGFWNGHAAGEMEVDGFHVVTAGMLYAYARGFNKVKVLHYATSADATGDSSRVVGYASVAFYREALAATEDEAAKIKLTPEQKARLLAIARETLDTFVRTGKAPKYHEKDPRLSLEEGAFVTLNKHGALRGCIGNIIGSGPLYQTVSQMAVAAASEDPRFRPISAGELKDIDIEISVLSRPRVVHSADGIELGKHGVIVSKGYLNRGVFLPQVATETGWSKDRFLAELCSQKAGLPPDSWKNPAVKLEVFTADVFGEKS
ncbi:MAG: AmmeMemoRadiSam system protein B [Smithella sp.]